MQAKTLRDAILEFSDEPYCVDYIAQQRWPDGVVCPRCGSDNVSRVASRLIWQCKGCRKQFSVKVGTIFEDSPIPLSKWLPAIWLLASAKNGISSYELAKTIGVTQKSGWFMLHRIRLAMQSESLDRIGGQVEVDETFIGGKARFMHKDRRAAAIKGRGAMGKTAVMGLLERHGPDGHSTVRAKVIDNVKRRTLSPTVRLHVVPGSEVFTDAFKSYADLGADYIHQVIDHAESYAKGVVHTNGIENFWSLLKRAIKGTYVSVEPFHLFRYLDEESFRYNSRKLSDAERVRRLVTLVEGKRLTYNGLIGDASSD
jgi:transposase-like protein